MQRKTIQVKISILEFAIDLENNIGGAKIGNTFQENRVIKQLNSLDDNDLKKFAKAYGVLYGSPLVTVLHTAYKTAKNPDSFYNSAIPNKIGEKVINRLHQLGIK